MDLYKKAMSDYNSLTEEITRINKRLSELPEGSLVIHKGGSGSSGFKWFIRKCNETKGIQKREYIPKAQRSYAASLAEKTLLRHRLNEARKKEAALRGFLRHYPKTDEVKELLEKSPGLRELLLPINMSLDEALMEWQTYPFEFNRFKLENKSVRTLRGDMVRSKAEAMIANTLLRRNIAYRYECALLLGGTVIYPDFIMIRPGASVPPPDHQLSDADAKRIIVIEHNGLMHDPRYVNRLKHKSALYYDYGFFPSRNLIMTYETSEEPFDISYFIRELDYYYT